MAVLEAMGSSLPVLLTPGCNFSRAAAVDAAVENQPSVEGTVRGLRRLLGMSDAERSMMGERALRLIESEYTWDSVAKRMLRVYRWLAGEITQPDDVVTK